MEGIRPFAEVFHSYQPLLKRLSRRYSFPGEREESYAIACMACFEAYSAYQPHKGEFGAYLKSYVRGRLLTYLKREIGWRSAHVFPSPAEDGLIPWEWQIADERAGREPALSEHLRQALSRLTTREREALVHRYVKDRPLQELAERYGVSHSTVMTWKRRGLGKMKKWLAEEGSMSRIR